MCNSGGLRGGARRAITPPGALISEKTQGKCPLGCPYAAPAPDDYVEGGMGFSRVGTFDYVGINTVIRRRRGGSGALKQYTVGYYGKIPKTGLIGSTLNQQAQIFIFPFALNACLPTTTSW